MVLAIALNVIFAVAVVVGIVTLLARSIRAQAAADAAPVAAARVTRAHTRGRRQGVFVPAHSA